MELLTIPEALIGAAAADRCHFTFHLADAKVGRSAADILERATGNAATLVGRGVRPGDTVGLIGPNRPEWVEWAYGVWMAGAVLVPLPAPVRIRDGAEYAGQIRSLAGAMGCVLLVGDARFLDVVGGDDTLTWDIAPTGAWTGLEPPSLDAPALVLCTSGSTSAPKGAVIAHRTVASREAARAELGTAEDGDVTWLPLFHTGGILAVLRPVYHGLVAHILPAERFARDPLSWFRLISEVRGASTSGASSAWRAALLAAERKPDGIDLSSVRRAVLSLETIDPDVLDRLVTTGARIGLRPEALTSAYGMSECTGISTTDHSGIRVDRIDIDELSSSGRAVPTSSGPIRRVVSCGRPGPGIELRIVDPEGNVLGDRMAGEVVVRSGNLMRGYLGQADSGLTEDGWFHTGDVGYLAEGELFITGRIKEIIISHGHKYHPEDIERAAARGVDIAPERFVAFERPGEKEGEVVVLVEAGEDIEAAEVTALVRQAVVSGVGQLPMEVLVVAPGSLPKTPVGKMRRNEAKLGYQQGTLEVVTDAPAPPA